jgi:hypothetical protein
MVRATLPSFKRETGQISLFYLFLSDVPDDILNQAKHGVMKLYMTKKAVEFKNSKYLPNLKNLQILKTNGDIT